MSSNQLIYFLVLILLRCKLSFNASFWVIHSIRNEIRPHSSLQEQYTFWIFYIISFTKSHKMFYENAPHFLAWDPFYGWNRNRGKMENPNPKKIFFRFTFLFSEKIGARKIKNTKKTFLLGMQALWAAAGRLPLSTIFDKPKHLCIGVGLK